MNKNEILYIQSIDISTIKKKIISETWESIHCTPDDSPKDCEWQGSDRALADVLDCQDFFCLNYKKEEKKYKG